MNRVPRITWIALGGVVFVVAIILLTPPQRNDISAETLHSDRIQRESLTNAPSLLASYHPPRSLESYSRLSKRNIFKPLVGGTITGTVPLPNGPLGLLPQGITGLPPAGPNGFGPFGSDTTPKVKTLGPWSYVGYSSVDGMPSAVMENKAEHQGRAVHVGDQIEGATVTAITRTQVRLNQSGKPMILELTDLMDTVKNPAPAGASGSTPNPAPGGNPPPANPPGTPPPGAPPNSAPAPSSPPPPQPAPTGLSLPAPVTNGPVMIERKG